ncbi:hypothetical protein [Phenylobacterium sp.]|uniref:hypothetical protein n=1 Tax=Phenylobacterium sp. TaxID=1871053 RepID=UPI002736C31C|nr:hypothetical protein [Phenylobacterium sp.]MDP3854771.1 hypothetical protein [Phenylobacterium sp.]
MKLRQKHAVLAAVTVATVFAGGMAQAQSYERYGPPSAPQYDTARYGSADPCRRTAGNRALGWGLFGLVAGGFAGGAVAAAGVVAEGAALGALAGTVIGAKAGAASAACESAAYWNHPAYQSYQDEGPPADDGHQYEAREYGYGYGDDRGYDRDYERGDEQHYRRDQERPPMTYYERRTTPNSNYEYRSSYSSSTTYGGARYNAYSDRSPCCDDRQYDRDDRDAYRPRHEHYESAPRGYDGHSAPPRDPYDRY